MDPEQITEMIASATASLTAGDRPTMQLVDHRDAALLDTREQFDNRHVARLADVTEGDEYRSQCDAGGLGVSFVFAVRKDGAELHAITFDAKRFTTKRASEWLAENDFPDVDLDPASDPPAGRRAADGGLNVRYRHVEIRKEDIDEENRTVRLAFSSEFPVKRWFGTEILDHKPKSVRMDRLRNGAPLLLNHDYAALWGGEHIGVHESASIDKDKRGRAVVRFSRSARGQEIFDDVIDGIRRHVSTGYIVHAQQVEDRDKEGRPISFRVTDWEPLENSIVSIPADPTVGVGRDYQDFTHLPHTEDNVMPEKRTETRSDDTAAAAAVVSAADITSARKESADDERARISDILDTGQRFDRMDDATKAVASGMSIDDFNKSVLESMSNVRTVMPATDDPELGLTFDEKQRYSICRAILASADQSGGSWKKAGFERECSVAVAAKLHRDPEGFFLPWDIMVEPRQTRLLDKATEGADLIATDLQTGNIIELLRNRLVVMMAGARPLTGLVGDVAIPRHSGGASAFWVAEASAVLESTPTFDQVALTPKTVGTFIEMTRKLLLQSSLDVENFVRLDIIDSLARELDTVALRGTGASNQPTGIASTSGIGDVDYGSPDGGAPTWPLIVEHESDVAAANADAGRLAYMVTAVARGKLKTTEKATGTAKFLWDTDNAGATPVNGYPVFVTNTLRSNLTKGIGSNLSEIIFGNFAELLIALWTGTDIIVNPFAKDTQGTLRITVLQDADVGVRHPASFSYGNEMTT